MSASQRAFSPGNILAVGREYDAAYLEGSNVVVWDDEGRLASFRSGRLS